MLPLDAPCPRVCVCVGRLRVTVTGAVGLCVIRDLTAIILSAISWMIHWREREREGVVEVEVSIRGRLATGWFVIELLIWG